MSTAFDPTGLSSMLPGQQLSQSQQRYITMYNMVQNDFKEQDQYVIMTPKTGPEAIKCLSAQHAAQVLYDKEGRLATDEEIKAYKLNDELARQDIQRNIDRHDLAKSVQRVLRD